MLDIIETPCYNVICNIRCKILVVLVLTYKISSDDVQRIEAALNSRGRGAHHVEIKPEAGKITILLVEKKKLN